MSTPMRTPRHSRSKSSDSCKFSENLQPNIPISTPSKKATPSKKSASRSASKPRNIVAFSSPPPPPPPRERKFVIAKKKNSTKQVNDLETKKRREAAYEKLRASQEEFFKKDIVPALKDEVSKNGEKKEELEKKESLERKTKSMVMEEAMNSIPEPGSGRVKHLVKAFESLLSVSAEEESGKKEKRNILMDWLMPKLPPKVELSDGCPSSPDFSSVELLPVRGHERELRLCSSWDGLDGRLSLNSRTSGGGRRSRRHSLDSSRKCWNRRLKVTNQQPFKLRTEQRGRLKEQSFLKKVTNMLLEEEKRRIPIAQGVPWTIDEPECLIKPPVKECTEPLDIVLHSDVRAIERAEFDQYVMERLDLAKQFKMERERRQKMEEEEQIRRLRRELVPRAQPMPYFDRPFIPKKSGKPRTVPKEPKFHVRPVEEPCVSLLAGWPRIK